MFVLGRVRLVSMINLACVATWPLYVCQDVVDIAELIIRCQ